jgi:hypothetical protein
MRGLTHFARQVGGASLAAAVTACFNNNNAKLFHRPNARSRVCIARGALASSFIAALVFNPPPALPAPLDAAPTTRRFEPTGLKRVHTGRPAGRGRSKRADQCDRRTRGGADRRHGRQRCRPRAPPAAAQACDRRSGRYGYPLLPARAERVCRARDARQGRHAGEPCRACAR